MLLLFRGEFITESQGLHGVVEISQETAPCYEYWRISCTEVGFIVFPKTGAQVKEFEDEKCGKSLSYKNDTYV